MYSQALDIYIAPLPLISSSKSVLKEYGAVIDGMCENWHHIIMIILDWTSVKTVTNSLHFIFSKIFLNNFYLVLMENESIEVEHIWMKCQKSPERAQSPTKLGCDLW